MNACLKIIAEDQQAIPLTVIYGGEITGFDNDSQYWVINDHVQAQCAVSLLFKPDIGDTVCYVEMKQEFFIVQLLQKKNTEKELFIESKQAVHWLAPKLRFSAFQELDLVSLNRFSIMSKNAVMSIADSLLQQSHNLIQKVGQFSLHAKGLLRLNGKQQIITAEEDVRIDGKRINMG